MTALTMSPFLVDPPGAACFTDAVIISPMVAYFLPDPPRTLIVMISRAPELSAILSLDCC
jgi:hypothetical protein